MDQTSKITLLFDQFSQESRNLYESFQNAGADFTAAVIEDDGFLPEGVASVYGFFCEEPSDVPRGTPKYFNQIPVPEYWRIEANNTSGKVMDKNKERARIFYTEPTHKRLVKIVDWLDDCGKVRLSEHYNRYGEIFCRTIFNKKGQKAARMFYTPQGQERIVENFVTGDIIVKWKGKEKILRSKTELICFFLHCAGLADTKICFNSLSYPFFASQALEGNNRSDVLFWNEPVGDAIPGNMQIILNHQATRTGQIYVQRKQSYERLIQLGASPDMVKQMGYIYSFIRNNQHRPQILICTNSENVSHIHELAAAVPGMQFHIAAITEMSAKLMEAGTHANVFLYPNVKKHVLDRLFETCDFYLDINHEGEIVDAIHRAFLNNQLIIGFEETMHNGNYTADTNTFPEAEYREMAEALNTALQMPQLIDRALEMQHKAALSATQEDYRPIVC